MITLSDPAGAIPFALAKRAVPGEIAKDVGGLIDLLAAEARARAGAEAEEEEEEAGNEGRASGQANRGEESRS